MKIPILIPEEFRNNSEIIHPTAMLQAIPQAEAANELVRVVPAVQIVVWVQGGYDCEAYPTLLARSL